MTGIEAIAAERQRQIKEEGWSINHDDNHRNSDLARAAAAYAYASSMTDAEIKQHADSLWGRRSGFVSIIAAMWPWEPHWFKPWKSGTPWRVSPHPETDQRQMVIKAGALCAAEIDRLDRAAKS